VKVLLRIKKHGGVDCWDRSDLALGWKKQTLNDDDDDDTVVAKSLASSAKMNNSDIRLFLIGSYTFTMSPTELLLYSTLFYR
jgi:hypothetical protein